MKTTRITRIVWALCAFVLVASCGNAWSAPTACKYPKTITKIKGSGIGGTGSTARGSGIGGTGAPLMRVAGTVADSDGIVEARSNSGSRMLRKNEPVCEGETVVTSPSGKVRLIMADGALIEVRAQSKLAIEKYTFGRPGKNASLLALNDGAARFVTGKIGKENPQTVLLKTPTAIIGVHGTDHEATVILAGASEEYPAGTYDKVNSGITYIRTELGEIDIQPNQVGFAASEREPPELLHDMPAFFHTEPPGTPNESLEDAQPLHGEHAGEMPEDINPLEHEHSIFDGHGIDDLPEPPEVREPPEPPEGTN